MQLKARSLVVRWAYLWSMDGIPDQTSLCALFWRTVLVTPLKLLVPVIVLSMVAAFIWLKPLAAVASVVGMAAIAGFGALMGYLADRHHDRRALRQMSDKGTKPSVLIDGFYAVKGKVCPIVELTR